MPKAKVGSVQASAMRVRLTIPRDPDGLMDYLHGFDPSHVNIAIYNLMFLGFLNRTEGLRNASMPATHSRLASISGASLEHSMKKVEQSTNQDASGDAETDLNNFELMFSESHKVAMR